MTVTTIGLSRGRVALVDDVDALAVLESGPWHVADCSGHFYAAALAYDDAAIAKWADFARLNFPKRQDEDAR